MLTVFNMYNGICKICRVYVCVRFRQILPQISFSFSYFFPHSGLFPGIWPSPHHYALFCSLSCFFMDMCEQLLGAACCALWGTCADPWGYITEEGWMDHSIPAPSWTILPTSGVSERLFIYQIGHD